MTYAGLRFYAYTIVVSGAAPGAALLCYTMPVKVVYLLFSSQGHCTKDSPAISHAKLVVCLLFDSRGHCTKDSPAISHVKVYGLLTL